ncbi:MAG TPA: hypothetical protein VI958_08065, partial [Acidobacteriota bacterium]
FGEFIDFINEEFIQNAEPFIARYVADILPARLHPDLRAAYQRAFEKTFTSHRIHPEFVFYYFRTLVESDAGALWDEFQQWLKNERTPLQDWLEVELKMERKLNIALQNATPAEIEAGLLSTAGHLQLPLRNLRDVLRHFRFEHWDNLADWNDFTALAKTVAENCHIKKMPTLQRASEEAVQLLFPISPPERVLLQFGRAAGGFDSARFIFELGKGFFYSGMSSNLPFEKRICGDPSLPFFWGSLFSLLLADRTASKTIVSLAAEPIAKDMSSAFEFWSRYDAVLALYRMKVDDALKTAQDLYVSLFEMAFPFRASHSLHLFDLSRSREAFYRFVAYTNAVAATERLRELYGTRWFANERWARRMSDYWQEGFGITLQEVLHDLGV